MRYRLYVLLVFIGLMLFVAGGVPRKVPTISPVYSWGGRSSMAPKNDDPELFVELMAKTNCVDFGKEITFYLSIKNERTYTITLEKNRKLDIVLLERYGNQQIERHWSQSAQYPSNLRPTFAPGEQRIYQWRWKAEPTYRHPEPAPQYSD